MSSWNWLCDEYLLGKFNQIWPGLKSMWYIQFKLSPTHELNQMSPELAGNWSSCI